MAATLPKQYRTVFENDRVRVLEYRSRPGEKTEPHSHPDLVAIAIQGAKVRFDVKGQMAEAEFKPGEPVFAEATEHTTENIGTGDAHVILVELK